MEPEEWQRSAQEIATTATTELESIERDFGTEPVDSTFRSFWPRIRELSQKIQTAPAIDIEVKLDLLSRIRQISRKVRERQEIYFEEQRHRQAELLDSMEEVRAAAMDSRDPSQVRQLRQDLMAFRESASGTQFASRQDQQRVWQAWQGATQQVWDHLNQLWAANEAQLTQLLDTAQSRLDRGNVRDARESVRQFNASSRDAEVSHKASRSLRTRANTIWRQADEVAAVKHEAFMAQAPEKLEKMKEYQGRNAKAIARVRAEIADLEAAGSATGVGAAFAKAMIDDKIRELRRLEETNDSLEHRIDNTEAALSPAG
jgi:hypothetical protein